ncbi:hypothetical protein [Leptospira mayottensis]|uniref:Uncharacterized protein n=2 Tax=Leptospira mayottensis TaxID=1137606 RepID=A0AA87MJ94_9LEPT|nr:hypothetical protein [Leptospira mayottensis]AXR66620.1 hypothetical protein DQM28_20740 [Leptospira mayottensis]AZQ04261.1 hypothetical protein LEP1GSC190_19675 [Leptospira mayottensis 200901116]EKR98130.1 hypothetical protein LEP1GSC125_1535 [Leptospira mayottensis 200901122]TGN04338.1 hypothetical protein EHR03_10880 [Leptospira mayottensis]
MTYGFEGDLNKQSEDYEYHDLSACIYPDLEKSNTPLPGWGCIIHPDELRRIMFFGNEPLLTTRGTQLEDFQLKNWCDQTVRAFASEIDWDIYPRLFRSRPLVGQSGRFDLEPKTGRIEDYAEWDDTYDYDPSKSSNFFLKLRRKNLCRLHKWVLTLPWNGNMILDLTSRATIQYKTGILRAVFTRVPFGNVGIPQIGIQGFRFLSQNSSNLPGAYQVDYTTGYDHASRVPRELKDQVLKYFVICVLSSYGEGIIGGISNYSTSVGVISESIGTTMSAENAFFGARIRQLSNELKEWWKTAKIRYTGISFGALG